MCLLEYKHKESLPLTDMWYINGRVESLPLTNMRYINGWVESIVLDRIRRNLKIDTIDVVEYCKNKVLDKNCNIYKQGKNWYCEVENIKIMILSRLVDTFISRISLTMLPVPNPHNTACVLSWEEARHWQSRSSDYSSS